MSFVYSLLIYGALVLRIECIIGGTKTPIVEFPSLVLVKFKSSHYCGASILHQEYIITNAQCAIDKEGIEGIAIHFNDLSIPGRGKLFPVADIHVHQDYEGNTEAPYNDIALIRLKEPLTFNSFVNALPVYEKKPYPGLRCQTAGYGIISIKIYLKGKINELTPENTFSKENVLRKVDQIIQKIETCEHLLGIKLNPKIQICTVGPVENEGPTYGDFGGPLICENQQIGVSTFSLYDSKSMFLYTVYSNILTYREWVERIITEQSKKKRAPVNENDTTLGQHGQERRFVSENNKSAINFEKEVANIGTTRKLRRSRSNSLYLSFNEYFIVLCIFIYSSVFRK